MTSILEYLEEFNRKERFFLVAQALGNPSFRLSPDFRRELRCALGLDVPEGAFVAMDYHLDWLYASVYLHQHGGADGPHHNLGQLIRAQQQDIDLLIAYQDGATCHLILLEAKGVIAFNNQQLGLKAIRLEEIFGESGDARPGAKPHFAIVSPKRPQHLKTGQWPVWMRGETEIPWIKLELPGCRKKITRCTDQGVQAALGRYWKVDSV